MDSSKWPARVILPVAQPGLIFILIAILITGMFFYFKWIVFAWVSFALTLFICWFFRDPDRDIPKDGKGLISPADGKVIVVEKQSGCEYLTGPCIKVSIFMNVFNVHVNRVPYDGVVQKIQYSPGKFINASFDKASIHNERNALIVKTADGRDYAVVQIAGLIARRIVWWIKENETAQKGERFGMIRFGSRIEVFMPLSSAVLVNIGDKVRAGETPIGELT